MKFSIKDFFSKSSGNYGFGHLYWSGILNGKLHFLSSAFSQNLFFKISIDGISYKVYYQTLQTARFETKTLVEIRIQ